MGEYIALDVREFDDETANAGRQTRGLHRRNFSHYLLYVCRLALSCLTWCTFDF